MRIAAWVAGAMVVLYLLLSLRIGHSVDAMAAHTGGRCDHGRRLCQHELSKALALCRGGPNITAWIWRR